jgi:hypothetical protein
MVLMKLSFKNHKVLTFILTIVLLIVLFDYIYVFLYQPAINIPNQLIEHPTLSEKEVVANMAERWHVPKERVAILAKWNVYMAGEEVTCFNILDKKLMSGARMCKLPKSSHQAISYANSHAINVYTIAESQLYLFDEYIPKTQTDRQIVRNYYSNKYPWLGSLVYNVIVQATTKKGWLAIGNAFHPLIFGFPLNYFTVNLD